MCVYVCVQGVCKVPSTHQTLTHTHTYTHTLTDSARQKSFHEIEHTDNCHVELFAKAHTHTHTHTYTYRQANTRAPFSHTHTQAQHSTAQHRFLLWKTFGTCHFLWLAKELIPSKCLLERKIGNLFLFYLPLTLPKISNYAL